MKQLIEYINEWQLNKDTNKSVKQTDVDCFIYVHENHSRIRIFNHHWPQFNDYKDKVYVNGICVGELDEYGQTQQEYKPGEYKITIDFGNGLKDCTYMFSGTYVRSVPLFNTSNVVSMKEMFRYCQRLEKISLFNTEKVENMWGMFQNCDSLKTVPKFNTKNVTFFGSMFWRCNSLETVPLFDISDDANIDQMFRDCDYLLSDTKRRWSKIYDFYKNNRV